MATESFHECVFDCFLPFLLCFLLVSNFANSLVMAVHCMTFDYLFLILLSLSCVLLFVLYLVKSLLSAEGGDMGDGGDLIRSWSSCICNLIGRRSPQEMLSKPSTISSPSSCARNKKTRISTINHKNIMLIACQQLQQQCAYDTLWISTVTQS